jgi:hypothetical protein
MEGGAIMSGELEGRLSPSVKLTNGTTNRHDSKGGKVSPKERIGG